MNVIGAPSCLECKRRKQKCNRIFPCSHCLKRGVAHLCCFPSATKSDISRTDSRASRKHFLNVLDDLGLADNANLNTSDALSALGYMPESQYSMGVIDRNKPKDGKDSRISDNVPAYSEEIAAALQAMPPKPYIDCLVDNFLSNANYHWSAIYPSDFKHQYESWCAARSTNEPLSPEFTTLILRVCACSTQFLADDAVKERIEEELVEDAHSFSRRMHIAATKLSATIPPGKGGLTQIQELFHAAYWFKAEEDWISAWHVLSTAIRSANELGLHKDSLYEGLSEYDREMRRRLWGLLYMWDFAIGSMLARPLLVNHADADFTLPEMYLDHNPAHPGLPSPFKHVALHCVITLDLMKVLGTVVDKALSIQVIYEMKRVVDEWIARLPPVYALENPVTKWDKEFPYVVLQRRYLHLIGYMCLFDPLKPYVTGKYDPKVMATDEERAKLRMLGITTASALTTAGWKAFQILFPNGAKFHHAIFCIFDTATVLCSALVHDTERTFPHRTLLIEHIKTCLHMLEEFHSISRTLELMCGIVKNLIAQLPLDEKEKILMNSPKRLRTGSSPNDNEAAVTPQSEPNQSGASNGLGGHASPGDNSVSNGSSGSWRTSDAAPGHGGAAVSSPGEGDPPTRSPGLDGAQQAVVEPAVETAVNTAVETIIAPLAAPTVASIPAMPAEVSDTPLNDETADLLLSPLTFVPLEELNGGFIEPNYDFGVEGVEDVALVQAADFAEADRNEVSIYQIWDWQGLDLGDMIPPEPALPPWE